MNITCFQDTISIEATHEELVELKNLVEFCAENDVRMDTLYEMISGLLRPKIVITHTDQG